MKVLLLIPSMAGVGGTERVVHLLAGLLTSLGHEVIQASFDPAGSKRHFAAPCPYFSLGPLPTLPLALRVYTYVLSAMRLRRLKKECSIDVTISNLWRADLISALALGRDRKIALCHINVAGNATNRLMLRLRPFVAAVYRRFDKVVAVNEALSTELRDLYGLRQARIGFVDNFTDPPVASSCLPSDGVPRFVWCGRLSPEKNVEGMLRVWSAFLQRHAQAQLLLLGDGPQFEDAKTLAHELNLLSSSSLDEEAKVVFVGQVHNPADYMAGATSFVLTSSAEGMPMVVLEALALGIPVLASDCASGGVRRALHGTGTFDADRKAPERTTSGMLLPVPHAKSPESIKVWADALILAATSTSTVQQWRTGALGRAELFSTSTARSRWQSILNETCHA
jgi:glycosyltransferase involved in cell wall biosynthesis